MLFVVNPNDCLSVKVMDMFIHPDKYYCVLDTEDLVIEKVLGKDIIFYFKTGVQLENIDVSIHNGQLCVQYIYPLCTWIDMHYLVNNEMQLWHNRLLVGGSNDFVINKRKWQFHFYYTVAGLKVSLNNVDLCIYALFGKSISKKGISHVYLLNDYLIIRQVEDIVSISTGMILCTTVVMNKSGELIGVVPDRGYKADIVFPALDTLFITKLAAMGGLDFQA